MRAYGIVSFSPQWVVNNRRGKTMVEEKELCLHNKIEKRLL
jgi:hypothetical protein